jgi:hypothetical protein
MVVVAVALEDVEDVEDDICVARSSLLWTAIAGSGKCAFLAVDTFDLRRAAVARMVLVAILCLTWWRSPRGRVICKARP